MYGEVINSLFALFDKCIAVYLPCQFLYITVYFLKCLIDRYSPHRYWAVADNPLAGLVYVVACREVHQCVSAPIAAPHGFFNLFLYAGRESGVSDI